MYNPTIPCCLSSSGSFFTENLPRLGSLGSLKAAYTKVIAEKIPMLKNVIRHPTCRPIILPKGIPNIIATDEPVTTMLSAIERYLSGTMRTAIGEDYRPKHGVRTCHTYTRKHQHGITC